MLFLKIKAFVARLCVRLPGSAYFGERDRCTHRFLTGQASLRSRERIWDIRVPKIDSIFDNSLVPRSSWSPGVPPQHRKLVAATHRSPNMTGRHVRMLPWDPLWHLRHAGYPVSPRGYRRLPAFASLSMAGSGCKYKNPFYHNCCLRGTALDNKSPKL